MGHLQEGVQHTLGGVTPTEQLLHCGGGGSSGKDD